MSCNVYADSGFKDPDLWLQKADLVIDIKHSMKARGLTPARAAKIVGMPLPEFREMIKGHFGGIGVERLVDCLRRLGHDVHITIDPLHAGTKKPGTFTVTQLPVQIPRAG